LGTGDRQSRRRIPWNEAQVGRIDFDDSEVIDDGRRWLVEYPQSRFDLVVMNTTFHWRAHASDFLRLMRSHLSPGGMLYYNTTGSGEVLLTGATVSPLPQQTHHYG
jgi:spermidine synthase